MIGPCLCGDPCCPSCGDPGACEMEAAYETFWDILEENEISPEELGIFLNVGLSAVLNARELAKEVAQNVRYDSQITVDMLKRQLVERGG